MWEAWESHEGEMVFKIDTFPDAHQFHLARFRDRPVTMLEIGVFAGGSLQLWQRYLGGQARLIGLDIDPNAGAGLDAGEAVVLTGDQTDVTFLEQVAAEYGPFDIVSDDGGHTMDQQRISFETLFPHVADDGVYMVEDTCTSYWPDFGGGLGEPGSFVEFAKSKIDELNAWFVEDGSLTPGDFTRSTASMHFYPGIIIVEKRPMRPPRYMGAMRKRIAYEDLAERRRKDREPPRGG